MSQNVNNFCHADFSVTVHIGIEIDGLRRRDCESRHNLQGKNRIGKLDFAVSVNIAGEFSGAGQQGSGSLIVVIPENFYVCPILLFKASFPDGYFQLP